MSTSTEIKEFFIKRMDQLNLSSYDLSLILNKREKQIEKWLSKDYDFNIKVLNILSSALNLKITISFE